MSYSNRKAAALLLAAIAVFVWQCGRVLPYVPSVAEDEAANLLAARLGAYAFIENERKTYAQATIVCGVGPSVVYVMAYGFDEPGFRKIAPKLKDAAEAESKFGALKGRQIIVRMGFGSPPVTGLAPTPR